MFFCGKVKYFRQFDVSLQYWKGIFRLKTISGSAYFFNGKNVRCFKQSFYARFTSIYNLFLISSTHCLRKCIQYVFILLGLIVFYNVCKWLTMLIWLTCCNIEYQWYNLKSLKYMYQCIVVTILRYCNCMKDLTILSYGWCIYDRPMGQCRYLIFTRGIILHKLMVLLPFESHVNIDELLNIIT